MDNKKTQAFERILKIMDELREQCPWDRKQTIESLRHLTIEETYELSDAIVQNDWKNIKEELGDVLLHIVFYAKIGEEQQQTDIADIINSLCDKLIARHPHIYGNTNNDANLREVQSEDDVKKNWEQLKLKEGRKSVLGGVPNSLPSLIKAFRIQEKAGQVGFEWDNIEDVWKKVEEEIGELQVEISANISASSVTNQEKIQSEFGDVMFALVNYARYLNLDPEYCLELSNQKFLKRFRYIEETANVQGKNLKDMTLGEMDEIWNEAKDNEKLKTKN
ncbi:MAG TPA: nucleoside triphosphate pyrophosphohydrolase [Chitinophagales bacterium]